MKKILCCISEWGYWGEEIIGPLEELEKNNYEITFMTPKGGRAHALQPSMEPGFFDVPLKKVVTSEYYATKTREFDDSDVLDNTIDLSSWFPKRPYFCDENFGHALTKYHKERELCFEEIKQYDALLLPGGSGPMVDMVNNQQLHDVILGFYQQNKLIATLCYSVGCLAFARDWTMRKSIIWGKHITGHALEYDYMDGTGFIKTGSTNFGSPFYPLEYILRDATGPDGQYHGGVGHETSTILDYPFLTGRSTQDSKLVGELMIEVLENGLKRYGW
ncbi:MAG: type 1 glutamine amidotransferase domain-containing protein [Lachnospiraceae bacterium]|nr:type 1 glutamine amidotransferase domain-containing protein [Lachnospiraceae bacterium]